jgi:outer membrane protein TolC
MKYIYLALLICLVSPRTFAAFQPIWKGYLNSALHKSVEAKSQIDMADAIINDEFNDWKLSLNPRYGESNLARLFAFQAQKTKTTTFRFELSKVSYKYGTVSLTHEKIEYDISEWQSSALSSFSDDHIFETRTGISYSYDFLDRSNDKDFEILKTQAIATSLETQLEKEQNFLDFFTVYLQAKYQLFTVELTKSFVSEAQKRVNKTARREKEGSSRKIDLYQARSSLLNQSENLDKSRSNLKENLAIIENIVKVKISEKYFKGISWKKYPYSYFGKVIKRSEHLSLKALEARIKVIDKNLEKIKDQNGMKLLFTAGYTTNAIDANRQRSYEDHIDGLTKDTGVSLNLIIPLGIDKRRAIRIKQEYQRKKNKLDLQKQKDDLNIKKTSLIERIKYFEKITDSAKKKVELASLTAKEQNRLYLRGQSTFEEVIRAEEAYITTRLNEKKALFDYELLIANYAFLNNSIKPFLDLYRD